MSTGPAVTIHSPPLPPALADDLPPDEPVLGTAPCRLMATVEDPARIAGVVVLTTDRLVIVPGAPGSPPERTEERPSLLAELWRTAGLALLEAALPALSPKQKRSAPPLAARSAPGIQIPLSLVRSAFIARLPSFVGLELSLPLPDPRPPFPLYLELADPTQAQGLCDRVEAHRGKARPRPELERPYSLYYLLRPLPSPIVRLRGPGSARRGALRLGPDGPEIGGSDRTLILAYESVERVEWAAPTSWRKARLTLTAAEREWTIEPTRAAQTDLVYDVGQLLAELSGRPVDEARGPLRRGKIAGWTTVAGGTAAGVVEILLHFFL